MGEVPERRETSRARVATWVPAAFVIVTLAASLTVPFLAYERIEELRARRESLGDPALAYTNQLMFAFTQEISNFRGYLLTGDEEFVRRYRAARATGEQARQRLERYMPAIDGGSAPHLGRINTLLQEWHGRHDDLFDGTISREEYVSRYIREAQIAFAEIGGELALMQGLARAYNARVRGDTMRAVRTAAIAMASLVFVGLLSAMYVSRLSYQLEHYSTELRRTNREEAAFRAVASGLNRAASAPEVLRQVSECAVSITRADGAYVERVRPDGREVEVVATVGAGAPHPGTVIAYPGSVTAEMVARGEAVMVTSLSDIGPEMAPYLAASCRPCQIILVPLVSEEEFLGALVVLASDGKSARFAERDVRRARILADLAAVAMRRALVLESEREARVLAEEAAVAREEILGIVSHDLRAPLTTISLGLQLLDDRSREDEIRVLRDAAKRMERLVNDLLDAARIEQGRLSLRKREIDPRELIADSANAFAAAAEEKEVALEWHAAEDLPRIRADADRLMQVLANLISNALKFTPAGGRIDVAAAAEGDAVRFSVADSGPGIPRKDMANVFRRNWQAKKTAHLGAGLGLAIAKGIVEAHGGSIGVESSRASGAEFFFVIPRATSGERPS